MNYLSQFFHKLKVNNIQYCVLRNYLQLPVSTGGSDLDLLIHQSDIYKFNLILKHFIEINGLSLVSMIPDKRCPKYCISNGSWGIQIDVFKGSVYFGNSELIPSSMLFENTQIHQEVIVLKPKVGAILAFLKEILNNKTCSKKYKDELQNQFCDQKIEPHWVSQFNPEFQEYLNQHLFQLDHHHCLHLYKIGIKSFHRAKASGFQDKFNRLFQHPGHTITFLGTDGSGKSTIIKIITPKLNEAYHNAVYYEHMRPNKLPSIASLMGKHKTFAGPITDPHGSSRSGFLGSLARWSYYMLDYTFGFYLKIYPKKAIRSCVWIFDRYYYDYLIDQKRGRIKLPKWIIKFGKFIIPEPDIILCLGADAETIHKRKPELPLEEVVRQVAELKKFCKSHKRAVWIDTGKPIESSANDTLNAIISKMGQRFKSVNL